jgi:hypothetical protein
MIRAFLRQPQRRSLERARQTASRRSIIGQAERRRAIPRHGLAVPGEINIALVGHTDPSVNDKYGAKDKAIRFRHRLAEAVARVAYAGLDLSHLTNQRATKGHQGAHTPPRR